MPKYKRKKEAKYSLGNLIEAVEKVRQKEMNSYEASERYGIPRSTIIHRLYGTRGAKQQTPGRPTELSKEWETKVASHLHVMEKCGYPLTPKEVKILISDYIRRNGIITRFKDDYPGKEWFRGFKTRNKLSLKKPQSVEIARKKACDPFIVYNYFDMLERTIQECGLTDKPQHIYNLDETSFCNDPTKTKVVGLMGFPSTRTTGSPGRNNTTVLLATNALGKKIPPLIIFQGKHLWSEWLFKGDNVNTAYAVSQKGWMESTIFEQYLKSVFLPAIGAERPVLLIYDGHKTHVDLSVIDLLVAENITVLKLPAHSSHLLQPLDCSTMKPLKDKWDSELVKWQRLHVGAKLPKQEFARIITYIWDDLNPVIIQNGFRKAGICPLNKDAIPKEKFDSLTWSRWEEHQQQNKQPHTDTDYCGEETVKGSQTKKENKIPTLISVCLKTINSEIRQFPNENNKMIETITQETNNLKKMDLPLRKGTQVTIQNWETVENPKSFILSNAKNINNITQGTDILDKMDLPLRKGTQVTFQNWETVKDPKSFILSHPKNINNITQGTDILDKMDLPLRKGTQVTFQNWETVKDPKSFILSHPKNTNTNANGYSCNVKILDNVAVRLPVNKTKEQERVSFEDLLLKTISRNDIPKTSKKRISQGSEILTYKDALQRLKNQKEEKTKAEETKRLKKLKRTSNNKNQNLLKNKFKAKKNKGRKNLETDSESDCSYTSMNSSEDEDVEDFFQNILEESILEESIDKDMQEPLPSTSKGQKGKIPKIKSKRVNESQKIKFKQKSMTGNLYKHSTVLEERSDEDLLDSLPSTSKGQKGKTSKIKSERVNERKIDTDKKKKITQKENKLPKPQASGVKDLNVGDFILAEFRSIKGKRTYKYVCLIEDINQEKIVVKGLKSKKNNKEFKFIENDISIIDEEDVIACLPKAELNEQRDTVIFPYKVEVFECK